VPTPATTVAVIGAGRVGTALGVLLERAGHRVVATSGRDGSQERVRRYLLFAPFIPWPDAHTATPAADVVLIGVPDDRIEEVCAGLAAREAFREGQTVIHLSGSVGLEALRPAEERGAMVLSLHPLQTFPDVSDGIQRLPGSSIAVTARGEVGYERGESMARDVGANPFRLPDDAKPLYHAAAVFCSNYLVVVEGMAEHLFRLAGLEEPVPRFEPLARAALEAALARGPRRALTGPAARGDVGTVARNLRALAERAPDAVESYLALARVAGRLAFEDGRLSERDRQLLEEVLAGWR
jgi:predicted short-subunit dehydrogenase-like oxidoreductase (DUF2520 family)